MINQDGRDDEGASAKAEATAGLSRRGLLSAAAGGFALAASGLLLPERLVEEAEAADHPVRGVRQRKEQRREKARHEKHHGRHRRRTHGDHKGNREPGAIYDGIRWSCFSEAGPFDVEFWGHPLGRDLRLLDSQHLSNIIELQADVSMGALWLNRRYFLRADNDTGGLPTVWLGYGGSFSSRGWVGGTTVLGKHPLREGESARDMVVNGFKFSVERFPDDDAYTRFSLAIRKQ